MPYSFQWTCFVITVIAIMKPINSFKVNNNGMKYEVWSFLFITFYCVVYYKHNLRWAYPVRFFLMRIITGASICVHHCHDLSNYRYNLFFKLKNKSHIFIPSVIIININNKSVGNVSNGYHNFLKPQIICLYWFNDRVFGVQGFE